MIHYHGMAGAGKTSDHVELASGRHVFVSFAKPSVLPLVAATCSTFALDNGAFSAWKSNKSYSWEKFFDFAEEWGSHPACDFVVTPDVIDGGEKENDDLIEQWISRGPNVEFAPVWHMHESLERLERLAEHSRICLGSSGQYQTPGSSKWWGRMEEAMSAICESGRPKTKLHGLRMLDPRIFSKLPLHSADSTNAERNGLLEQRFGMYPAPSRGQRAAIIAARVESQQSAGSWQESLQETFKLL